MLSSDLIRIHVPKRNILILPYTHNVSLYSHQRHHITGYTDFSNVKIRDTDVATKCYRSLETLHSWTQPVRFFPHRATSACL
ncbi:hypothetical protein E2C01_029888 [Portunus trituberculatus]|uniref:Uncharacterized protein n=1 Tax=Portunus trituberculatus TaxID=210409 RepID=A0A5B7EP27_PORTR|nr:hypothetical protein [Portunus trituberculatus]